MKRTRAFPVLGSLIAPKPLEAFWHAVDAQTHLHVAGPSDRFSKVLQWSDFRTVLAANARHWAYPAVRLAMDGRVLPESAITSIIPDPRAGATRVLSAQRIARHLADGATLIVNSIEAYVSTVSQVVHALAAELQERVQANVYYSPGGRRGFPVHYDAHDVLVLQLGGTKRWDFFGFTYRLPLENQPHIEYTPPTILTDTVTLQSGDCLYVPRGMWHSVQADAGTPSFHLTLGIHAATRFEGLKWILERLESDALMRQPLVPLGSAVGLSDSVFVITDSLAKLGETTQSIETELENRRLANAAVTPAHFGLPDTLL